MKHNKIIQKILSPPLWGGWVGLLFSLLSCVNDDIYNTDHPEHARVSITIGWNDIGTGVDKPTTYIVSSGTIQEEVKSDAYIIQTLLEAGNREIYIYNPVPQIPVTGGVAKVNTRTISRLADATYIEPLPGWLFTGVLTSQLEKDSDYELAVAMHQQVRRLTLLLAPEGSGAHLITSMDGYLSGAAGELHLSDNTHSAPSYVPLSFTKITEGTEAGKWSASVQLLGIAGEEQKGMVSVVLAGKKEAIPIEIDLTESLSGFNNDKKTPLTLNSRFHIDTPPGPEPVQTEVSVLTDWSDRGTGVDRPSVYIISTTGLEEEATAENHTISTWFDPGTYPFYLYNRIPEIPVTGGIAKVNTTGGTCIHANPGWLFTGFAEAILPEESPYELKVTMHQQVRELTLKLEIKGNGADRVQTVTGRLGGAAGELRLSDGQHSSPSDIDLRFNKKTQGTDAGKWLVTVRLLGIAGPDQVLEATIRLADGREVPLQSDLSGDLATFNSGKKSPLTLQAEVAVEVEVEAGFTATIKNWEKVDGGSGIAI